MDMLIVGIIVAVLFTAKPTHVFLKELNPTAYSYIVLGLVMYCAASNLGWLGFFCVVTPYAFAQLKPENTRWLLDKFSVGVASCVNWFTNRFSRKKELVNEEQDQATREALAELEDDDEEEVPIERDYDDDDDENEEVEVVEEIPAKVKSKES